MRYVVTGAAGFLGWHTRARLVVDPDAQVVALGRGDSPEAWAEAMAGADAVLHLAGLNRGEPDELEAGNLALAERVVAACEAADARPAIVYAGSNYASAHHPGTDSPYGRGKRAAGERLRAWGAAAGAPVAEIRFPGLFGEHGRPDYNSFVATFADRVARGQEPPVNGDRELPLLPVGEAVELLLAAARERRSGVEEPAGYPIGISEVARRLAEMHAVYAPAGDIPAMPGPLDRPLFNTLRAAMWPGAYPFRPTPRSDARGTLVETIRVHGGGGQAFVSTTNPGFRRGEHVHFGKIERFQVLSGTGLIRLRRLLSDETIEFTLTGDEPGAVDMPTLWTHSIENVGAGELVTSFWTDELFDPDRPDTYPMPVLDGRDRPGHGAKEDR